MNNKIPEYRRLIESLNKKITFQQYIFDNLPGFIYINEASKYGNSYVIRNVYANKTALDTLCYSRDEIDILGENFFKEILHNQDYLKFCQSVEFLHLKENTGKTFGSPYRFKPKSQEYIWTIGYCKILYNESSNLVTSFLYCLIPISEEMLSDVQIAQLLRENRILVNKLQITKISKAELRVLKLLVRGLSAKLISVELNISENTVNSHKKNMMRKLCLPNSAALVSFAHNNGMD